MISTNVFMKVACLFILMVGAWGTLAVSEAAGIRFFAHDFPKREELITRIDSSREGEVLEIDVEKAKLNTSDFYAILEHTYAHKGMALDVRLVKEKKSFSFKFSERLLDPREVVVGSMEPTGAKTLSDEKKKMIWPVVDTERYQWITCDWSAGGVYLLGRDILLSRFLEVTDREQVIVVLSTEGGRSLKDFFPVVASILSQKKVVDLTFCRPG